MVAKSFLPEDLLFSKEHVWVRLEGKNARIGLSELLVENLGRTLDIDFVSDGEEAEIGSELGHISGAMSVCDVYSPLSGIISEVNEEVLEDPSLISDEPYGDGWLCVLSDIDEDECEEMLMDMEEYDITATDL
jgi:glycine cleavage system H protein